MPKRRDDSLNKLCRSIRQSKEYKEWRKKIIERDKEKYKNVQVHHLKPFREILIENNIKNLEEARECKELWNLSNGVTLRKGEHRAVSLIERMKFNTKNFEKAIIYAINKERQNKYK